MKTILMIMALAAATQVHAQSFNFDMPSSSDFEATKVFSYKRAVQKAESFASSINRDLDSVVAVKKKPFSLTAKYYAKAGQCKFVVKVGLGFVAKVTKANSYCK